MKPKYYMLVGWLVFIALAMVSVAGIDATSIAFPAFASGALFGKGYGIWAERSK